MAVFKDRPAIIDSKLLRLVSKTRRIMETNISFFKFHSGSSSCYQLFMTFLQAQLAEAINLQDRSVVAQLHETLRSIRQLPNGR